MISLLPLCASCVLTAPDCHIDSYTYQPCYVVDRLLRGPAVAYVPQPGDIVLCTDPSVFWKVTHDMALAFEPHSSMIVVARPDGSPAILQAGPSDDMFHVGLMDALPRLQLYSEMGRVWVRKRKTPLTAEQSACLTDFACTVAGRRFAVGRLALQLTPFRTRGPVRTEYVGKPHGARSSFFCSELVTESLCAAGLIDPSVARPSATYPHELFFDKSHNPYLNRSFCLGDCWEPPARWTSCPLTPILLPGDPPRLVDPPSVNR